MLKYIILFVLQDALALVRLDDLYLESFKVTDGKHFRLFLVFVVKICHFFNRCGCIKIQTLCVYACCMKQVLNLWIYGEYSIILVWRHSQLMLITDCLLNVM